MGGDLSASPSVRMSEGLDRRLRIAAAHEDMAKTPFIRRMLRADIDVVETCGIGRLEGTRPFDEIRDAAEAAGMADELDDDWWREWLYDAAREKAHEEWARKNSEENAEGEHA